MAPFVKNHAVLQIMKYRVIGHKKCHGQRNCSRGTAATEDGSRTPLPAVLTTNDLRRVLPPSSSPVAVAVSDNRACHYGLLLAIGERCYATGTKQHALHEVHIVFDSGDLDADLSPPVVVPFIEMTSLMLRERRSQSVQTLP